MAKTLTKNKFQGWLGRAQNRETSCLSLKSNRKLRDFSNIPRPAGKDAINNNENFRKK